MQIVPQYIDVEDRIAGPLTWKHLGWFFAGGGVMLIAYALLDRMTFYIAAFIIGIITVALAFVRPNGVSMAQFIGYGFGFLFRPKVYTWEREIQKNPIKSNKGEINNKKTKKEISIEDITALAQTLDSDGKERNEKIQQIIKEQQINKK
jgi:hypothetical protein